MDIEETYQKILKEIELGHRGLVRLSSDEIDELNTVLADSISNPGKLEKVLCVIEHASNFSNKFEPNLLRVLNSPIQDNLVVFTLNCARKHIIEARFTRGLRLEFSFLDALNKYLHHKNPEVVEWTLRTIEACGNQGVYFLKEFDKIKPPPWKWFNSHQRAVREIITLLERRWSPFEKPKP